MGNQNKNELLNKAVDLDPIGLIYSITASECEDFLTGLYNKQGINDAYVKVAVSGNEK